MVFIPKAALRYVSLTSFLLKTLEKLVDHPIRSTALRMHPLQSRSMHKGWVGPQTQHYISC